MSADSQNVFRPIGPANSNLETIQDIEADLILPGFTASDAWVLGSALRNRLLNHPKGPVVIDISLVNQNQCVFHAVTRSGVVPDNERWVARKRKTVLRWGMSSWYMHCKFLGDERAFAEKFALGDEERGTYAIHGGGFPIRVENVEGIVAVVVVSGLKQEEDHQVILETLREVFKE